jgi:molybdenum cofactor cytidylyltransferase
MFFGPISVSVAEGAILAHAVRQGELVMKKGRVLTAEDCAALVRVGVSEIIGARVEAGDVPEDEAARRAASKLAGAGARCDVAATGRVNLFARAAGILVVDAVRIDRFNAVDEALTCATLPHLKPVEAGEMIGTVKIIPFAVPESLLLRAMEAAGEDAIAVKPFLAKRIAVISTLLPGLKPSIVTKTVQVLEKRLAKAGAVIVADVQCAHDERVLRDALQAVMLHDPELVIVFGASAITDRRDVIPAALEAEGGQIVQFGMPVDPGNLLLVGKLRGIDILGAPGCARSPAENGFDWVLDRLLADVPVTAQDIRRMGVGGLLMEIVQRGHPRVGGEA